MKQTTDYLTAKGWKADLDETISDFNGVIDKVNDAADDIRFKWYTSRLERLQNKSLKSFLKYARWQDEGKTTILGGRQPLITDDVLVELASVYSAAGDVLRAMKEARGTTR